MDDLKIEAILRFKAAHRLDLPYCKIAEALSMTPPDFYYGPLDGKLRMTMIAGLMFNFGMLGAILCLCIALIGFALGGRVA